MRSLALCTAARTRAASGGAAGRSRTRCRSGKASRNQLESEKPGQEHRDRARRPGRSPDPALDRVHQPLGAGDWLPYHLLGELDLEPVGRLAEHLAHPPQRDLLAQPGRHAAVDLHRGARRDHVDLVGRVRPSSASASRRASARRRRQSAGSASASRAIAAPGSDGSSPERLAAARRRLGQCRSQREAAAQRFAAPAPSFSSALSPVRGIDAWPAVPWR